MDGIEPAAALVDSDRGGVGGILRIGIRGQEFRVNNLMREGAPF
jgi:hypothetical protein